MTIGYYTDNNVSQGVMRALSKAGIKTDHIKNFEPYNIDNPVFYGILRGSGAAMRHLQFLGEKFNYVDNGYFDAIYMNKCKIKDMHGKYRIVKNDMIEPMNIEPVRADTGAPRVLLLSPSPYTAFMYDTTPEDWNMHWARIAHTVGINITLRKKENEIPLEEDLKEHDAVLAFNSIGVMKAIEMGKGVWTTHGVIRNSALFGECVPYYDFQALKNFYEPKQFTLEEIADRGIECLQ